MNKLLRRCPVDGSYTLQKICPKCGAETVSPHPPKFSPDDKYIRYRIAERYLESQPKQKEQEG